MAKQRRTNTSVAALGGLLDTIQTVAAVELKDKPEELAKVIKMTSDMKDSNITTALELQDDSIEAMHVADEAEQAEAEEEQVEDVPEPPAEETEQVDEPAE